MLAGLTNADELLARMVNASKRIISGDDKLSRYLTWVQQTVASSGERDIDLGRRAVTLFLIPHISKRFIVNLQLTSDIAVAFDLRGIFDRIILHTKELSLFLRQGRGEEGLRLASELMEDLAGLEIFATRRVADVMRRLQFGLNREGTSERVAEEVAKSILLGMGLPEHLAQWSYEEAHALTKYLMASLLSLQCKKAALSISVENWHRLSAQMLSVGAD